jgi:hypothetical protein
VMIRDQLAGLLSRNAYYQLVEWAETHNTEGVKQLFISSMGEHFLLGDSA